MVSSMSLMLRNTHLQVSIKKEESSPLNSQSFLKEIIPLKYPRLWNISSQDKMTHDKQIVVPQIFCPANHSMACNHT
uniref:Putative ovule protein n=1 Tax=Solanum chacoense TaxID=4108 RepID=A0A0V0GRG3_SOLCH